MANLRIVNCDQDPQDIAWVMARLGSVTSSRVAAVGKFLTRRSGEKKPGDETEARAKLKRELACEILTEKMSNHFVSFWMEEGRKNEYLARAAYEFVKDTQTEQIGYAYHPTIKMSGCSPDAIVSPNGGAEFKCPKTETHLDYLLADAVPEQYKPQLYWQMAVMGWEWNDFVSHDPTFKKSRHRTLIVRLYRDDKIIREMEENVMRFNDEVQELVLKLDPEYIETKLTESIAWAKKQRGPQLVDHELMAALHQDLVP